MFRFALKVFPFPCYAITAGPTRNPARVIHCQSRLFVRSSTLTFASNWPVRSLSSPFFPFFSTTIDSRARLRGSNYARKRRGGAREKKGRNWKREWRRARISRNSPRFPRRLVERRNSSHPPRSPASFIFSRPREKWFPSLLFMVVVQSGVGVYVDCSDGNRHDCEGNLSDDCAHTQLTRRVDKRKGGEREEFSKTIWKLRSEEMVLPEISNVRKKLADLCFKKRWENRWRIIDVCGAKI